MTVVETSRCPQCRSDAVVEIIYGFVRPDDELKQALERGDVALGGCFVGGGEADFRCRGCGHGWRRDGGEVLDPPESMSADEFFGGP